MESSDIICSPRGSPFAYGRLKSFKVYEKNQFGKKVKKECHFFSGVDTSKNRAKFGKEIEIKTT
jgi:hypothetical protein